MHPVAGSYMPIGFLSEPDRMSKTQDIPTPSNTVPTLRDNRFWLDSWRDEQQYGFHQLEVSPLLPRLWKQIEPPTNGQVLVPLCGKSLDMLWLAARGYQVIGVELSPIAVKAFFKENGLKPRKTRIGAFTRWQSGSISIWCGDFFSLTPAHLGRIDAIFDRAALTAIPEAIRSAYLQKLIALSSSTTATLLLTIEDILTTGQAHIHTIDADLATLCHQQVEVRLLHTELLAINHAEQNRELTAHTKAYRLSEHPQH